MKRYFPENRHIGNNLVIPIMEENDIGDYVAYEDMINFLKKHIDDSCEYRSKFHLIDAMCDELGENLYEI